MTDPIDPNAKYHFTEKGREFIALSGFPWVDLSKEEFFHETVLLFLMWAGHNSDVTYGFDITMAGHTLIAEFFEYLNSYYESD